jgi:hypothetical protein
LKNGTEVQKEVFGGKKEKGKKRICSKTGETEGRKDVILPDLEKK